MWVAIIVLLSVWGLAMIICMLWDISDAYKAKRTFIEQTIQEASEKPGKFDPLYIRDLKRDLESGEWKRIDPNVE